MRATMIANGGSLMNRIKRLLLNQNKNQNKYIFFKLEDKKNIQKKTLKLYSKRYKHSLLKKLLPTKVKNKINGNWVQSNLI